MDLHKEFMMVSKLSCQCEVCYLEQIEDGHTEDTSNGKGLMHGWEDGRHKGKDCSRRTGQCRWKPPPPGWVKINVDGSQQGGS